MTSLIAQNLLLFFFLFGLTLNAPVNNFSCWEGATASLEYQYFFFFFFFFWGGG